MRPTTPLIFLLHLVPACADGPDDPQRDPPGDPNDDGSDDADPTTTADDGDTEDSGGPGDADDSSDGSDGATDSSGGDVEPMPCGDLCLPVAPNGWHGPAALMRTSSAEAEPDCGASHPVALATMLSDLVAPAAECNCYCDDALDVQCAEAIARVYDNPSCGGVADDSFAIGRTCTNTPTGQGWWVVEFAEPSGGACAPIESSVVGAPEYTRWTLCGGEPSAGACETGEACGPTPSDEFEANQCLWIEGDVACPSVGYTERSLVHAAIVDDRSCGECSCGAPVGACDGGEVLLDIAASCDMSSSIALWEAQPGDCLGEIYFESGMILQEATPFATCEPTMPSSLGSATLDQPTTVCCEAS